MLEKSALVVGVLIEEFTPAVVGELLVLIKELVSVDSLLRTANSL